MNESLEYLLSAPNQSDCPRRPVFCRRVVSVCLAACSFFLPLDVVGSDVEVNDKYTVQENKLTMRQVELNFLR